MRSLRPLLVMTGAMIGVSYPMSASLAAEPPVIDHAEIVSVPDGEPISAGGSSTAFAIALPDGASCPGDSANDEYHVQSYMVPVDLELEDIIFDGLGPAPYSTDSFASFRQPLYDIHGEPYDVGFTAPNPGPGEPGLIIDVPTFTFGGWPPGTLPVGRYHVGIACTYRADPTSIWDTTVQIVDDPADRPAGRRWVVLDGGRGGDGGASPATVGPLIAAVPVVAVLVLLARRRRAAQPSPRSAP